MSVSAKGSAQLKQVSVGWHLSNPLCTSAVLGADSAGTDRGAMTTRTHNGILTFRKRAKLQLLLKTLQPV